MIATKKVRIQVTAEDAGAWGGGFYETLKSAIGRNLPYIGRCKYDHPLLWVYADHVLFKEAEVVCHPRKEPTVQRYAAPLPLSVHRGLKWDQPFKPFAFMLDVPAWMVEGVPLPGAQKPGTVRLKIDVSAERIKYGIRHKYQCPLLLAMRDAGLKNVKEIQYRDTHISFGGKDKNAAPVPIPEFLKVWALRYDRQNWYDNGKPKPFSFYLDVPAAVVRKPLQLLPRLESKKAIAL